MEEACEISRIRRELWNDAIQRHLGTAMNQNERRLDAGEVKKVFLAFRSLIVGHLVA